MNIHAAAVLFVIAAAAGFEKAFSLDVKNGEIPSSSRRTLQKSSKKTGPVPRTSEPSPSPTNACQKTAGNGKSLADLTEAEASEFTDRALENLLEFIGPKTDAKIVQDQEKVDATTLLNRNLPDVVAGRGLGTKFVLKDVREAMDGGVTETVDADGNVLFFSGPVISISDGDIVISISDGDVGSEVTACFNGLSNLTSHTTYASSDNNEGTLIKIGGAASSTGAQRNSDGTFSTGYTDSRGTTTKDPETGETTTESEDLFRGANNSSGSAFTGDTGSKSSSMFDGNGVGYAVGSARSKGENIGELFSFTGETYTEGTTETFVNGTTVFEGTASADGNSVWNLNGITTFTSRGSNSAAGFLMLDAFGVPFQGGGYSRFTGSTTLPFFNFAFDGDAVAAGSFKRNANGSYSFAGFSCLGVPEECVYNNDGTFDRTTCIAPGYFCAEVSCVLNLDGPFDPTACIGSVTL